MLNVLEKQCLIACTFLENDFEMSNIFYNYTNLLLNRNERYRIRFERTQYLPSIQNNLDQPHTYGDIDIYDEVFDTDVNIANFETKDADSEILKRESDVSIELEHEDYDDFIDIQESSNSDSSYLRPKTKSDCENGSEMENELKIDIADLDSNEHSTASSESVISAEYVDPNPFIPGGT